MWLVDVAPRSTPEERARVIAEMDRAARRYSAAPEQEHLWVATGFCSWGITGGTVECWGKNPGGMTTKEIDLVTGQPFAYVFDPLPIPQLANCTAISVGHRHACALCSDDILCWGDHRHGARVEHAADEARVDARDDAPDRADARPRDRRAAGDRREVAEPDENAGPRVSD